jgi:phosphoribosylglycinamide formyltransferase-1
MKNSFPITVLISGGGTTLRNLIEKQDAGHLDAEIVKVVSSNPTAGGLDFAIRANIETAVVDHRKYRSMDRFSKLIFDHCRANQSKLIVMGGFLRRVAIPPDFENRVINIHPSLIPAFCGQGQYGSRVHKAVLEYGCKLSGCTVHFVDDDYDHGPIVAQRSVEVDPDDTPASLAARVFREECRILPEVINWIAGGRVSVEDRQVRIQT